MIEDLLTSEKGCDIIISVAREFPDIEFRLVGPVREDVDAIDRTENVILTGNKNYQEVLEELKKADLFMFLSHMESEGFSKSLVEAMAMGLPCIVTDWAANVDMVDDGKGGTVCQINNTNEVVEAVKRIIEESKAQEFGSYNYAKVKEFYSEEIILQKYMEEYEKLVETI